MADPTKPAEPATKLTKADVAKKLSGKVVVPILDKEGNLVAEKGVIKTEAVAIRAEHVLSFREAGDQIVAVLVDGQKIAARA